jgi:prophage regulatory protein
MKFLRRKEVVEKVGLCASHIHTLERAGKFPKHVMLSPRCAAWPEEAVEAWMKERIASPAVPVDMTKVRTIRLERSQART